MDNISFYCLGFRCLMTWKLNAHVFFLFFIPLTGVLVQDASTLFPPVALPGPAALPLLWPALRAERLLGLCHGQHGQRRPDGDDDEGWGRRLSRGRSPAYRTHVPFRLPLSTPSGPVLWPRSVRVCEIDRDAYLWYLCVWECREGQEERIRA